MPQHPFPEPGPDSEEPASSPLPPAAEGDGEGAGQGLSVCLPPEQLSSTMRFIRIVDGHPGAARRTARPAS